MSWEKVKLEDVIEKPISGEWGDEGNSAFVLRTTNFSNDGSLDLTDLVTRNISADKIERKKLLVGDTILEKSGGSPSQPVGRVVYFDIAKNNGSKYLCNNFTSIIRPRENVHPKYLFWFLFNNHTSKKTLSYQNKTTGIINLQTERYIKEQKIPLPSISTQKKIAAILDKADALRKKDQQLLVKYDELLQSIFYDMFGDPVKNEKGWEKTTCEDVFDMKLGKMLSAKNYKGTHLKPYLRNVNVQWGELDLSDVKQMDFDEKEFKLYELKKGDILVCEGGEVGRTSIYNGEIKECCYQNALHRLRIKDSNKINREYFSCMMFKGVTGGMIRSITISVTIQHFTLEKFKKLKIPLPPIALQNQFATIAQNIQQQKQQVKQQITQSENLFQSLLQKAFKGELVQ